MQMLKIACVCVFLLTLSVVPGFAQSSSSGAHGGIEIGAGTSYLTVPKGTSRSMGLGFVGGLFADLPLASTIKLQPEIQYEHAQSQVLGADRKFDYVTVPILVNMTLFKGLYVDEGPAFHFPVRATVAGVDVKSNTKQNISITIGVGKRVGRVGIEARWDSGIRQVQKTLAPGDVPTRPRSLTGVLAIGL
jgi:hypothetical protein